MVKINHFSSSHYPQSQSKSQYHYQVEGADEEEAKEPEYIPPKEVLFRLADDIIKFQLSHNEEIQAIDLMFELERTHDLVALTEESACERISLYLVSLTHYQATVEEKVKILKLVYDMNLKHQNYCQALRM